MMNRNPGMKAIILPLLFMAMSFSCLHATKKQVVGPKKETVSAPFLSADLIDKRIAYLNGILETKRLDDEDREIALSLLDAYKTTRSVSQGRPANGHCPNIIHLLFTHLSQLEEKYFLKSTYGNQDYSRVMNLFTSKREKIMNAYLSGDYQGVIDDCLELEAAFGPDSLTPEIGLLFAVSLARKGMSKEAVNIGKRIVRELEGKPDLIHLRASMIEWQLDLGNKEEAVKIYEKLIDTLDEREAICKRVREGVAGREKKIADHSKAEAGLPHSIEDLLRQVDKLVQRQAFTEAKLLLVKQRLRSQEGQEIEAIDQAFKGVELAEEKDQKEQNDTKSHERETLKLARKLIEEENFEEAITKLEELKDAPHIHAETRELRDLAIERLINGGRNKAAKNFLMAKKTTDPAKKEELLFSSYNILRELIEKYPSSNLIKKLHDHLKKVREELDKLGKDPGYQESF